MKQIFYCLFLLPLLFLPRSSSANDGKGEVVFVASTPGDNLMKELLKIRIDTRVDFIRWKLVLGAPEADDKKFTMDIVFGESQPNTLGFKGGGERRSITGRYAIDERTPGIDAQVYRLRSTMLPSGISIVRLTDNLFHFLTPDNKLMIGNGGWSYTLNREDPVEGGAPGLPALFNSSIITNAAQEVVFDGRTPCQEIAAEHPEMRVSEACFKLKWRLILRTDAAGRPTTYTVRKVVDGAARDVTGKWAITRGTGSNPDVTIYTIGPDEPEESVSLLVGDENVLFFLSKDQTLYTGNEDFSFTLNRKLN